MAFRLFGIKQFGGDFGASNIRCYYSPVITQESEIEHCVMKDLLNRSILKYRSEIRSLLVLLDFDDAQPVLLHQKLTKADTLRSPIQAGGFNVPRHCLVFSCSGNKGLWYIAFVEWK